MTTPTASSAGSSKTSSPEDRAVDVIDAGNGDDEVTGEGGRDILIGQDGNDLMTGGEGRDELYGGHADDRLDAGPRQRPRQRLRRCRPAQRRRRERLRGAQSNERESYGGPADIVSCGPGEDTVKANTYDRVKRDCEHLKGAIAGELILAETGRYGQFGQWPSPSRSLSRTATKAWVL